MAEKGRTVGAIACVDLSALWGDSIEVRRSAKEKSRYPLYLVTSCGPVMFNTRKGQDFLLERSVMSTPAQKTETIKAENVAVEVVPESVPVPYEHDPENPPAFDPNPPPLKPVKSPEKSGIAAALDNFFGDWGDDDEAG